MARPTGSRNEGYDERRDELLATLLETLVRSSQPMSLRGLAAAAGVSVPTLRHYFGDREAILAAVFAYCRKDGAEPLQHAATPQGDVQASIRELLDHATAGLEYGGLGALHDLGLREGLANAAVAEHYRRDVLDPTLDAFAARIDAHMQAGDLRHGPPRDAAMQLLGPLLLRDLHQRSLGGSAKSPIDRETFLATTAEAFLRAWVSD